MVVSEQFVEVCESGDLEEVKRYVNNGMGDVLNGLKIACNSDQNDVAKYFISLGGASTEALRIASRRCNLEIVELLVEHGCDIHTYDDICFKYAAGRGCLDLVKYLHRSGSNIHADRDEALVFASENNHKSVVEYLIKNGADVNTKNYEPIKKAFNYGALDCIIILYDNGADLSNLNIETDFKSMDKGNITKLKSKIKDNKKYTELYNFCLKFKI